MVPMARPRLIPSRSVAFFICDEQKKIKQCFPHIDWHYTTVAFNGTYINVNTDDNKSTIGVMPMQCLRFIYIKQAYSLKENQTRLSFGRTFPRGKKTLFKLLFFHILQKPRNAKNKNKKLLYTKIHGASRKSH